MATAERVSGRRVDKFERRRRELADAALSTLSELGYARTSLREIAQNPAFISYDLRSQALFEESLRADVLDIDIAPERMIWRIVSRYGELRGEPVPTPSAMTYGLLDGLFQQGLPPHFASSPTAAADLHARALDLLGRPLPA